MANLFAQFRALIPQPPLLVGTITATDATSATITLPDGATLHVRGAGTVDQTVFVRDGRIEGDAPSLSVVEIEV